MLFRWLFGSMVSKMMMPSQALPKDARPIGDPHHYMKSNYPKIHFNEGQLTSLDKMASINYAEFSQKPLNHFKDQKVIIHATGNNDFYENHFNEYISLAEHYPNHRIVAFNFRGTKKSAGTAWSEDNWVNDVQSLVKHYQNQGIDLENILLHGHSMGGALVTMAAAKIRKEEKRLSDEAGKELRMVKSVKVLNNRSFVNATEFILRVILQNKGAALLAGLIYGSLLGLAFGLLLHVSVFTCAIMCATLLLSISFVTNKVSFGLMRPLVQGILWLTFGTLDAGSAYQSLRKSAVDYITAKNDIAIKKEVGIHDLLRPSNHLRKAELRAIVTQNNDARDKREALSELLNIKDSKVVYADNPLNGFAAHHCPLSQLYTRHKARGHSGNPQISGQEVMYQKIDRLLKSGARPA